MFQAPKWRDVWAAVLFYIHFAAFIGISIFAFVKSPSLGAGDPSRSSLKLDGSAVRFLLIHLAAGVVTAISTTVLVLFGMYRSPEGMIHGAFIGSAVLYGVQAVALFYLNSTIGGVIFIIMAGLMILMYVLLRKRIAFSAIIMKTVVDVLRQYPRMLNVTAGSLVFSLFYLTFFISTQGWLTTIISATKSGEGGYLKFMLFYNVFSLFWTTQVIGNVVQTTIAGVYASYYFLHGTGQSMGHPTTASLKRAMSYSFGSICFGSLIVAMIQFVRYGLRHLFEKDSLAGMIIDCIIGIIEDLVEYFNYYAYTQIAIYGKSYIDAAKDTWNLIKTRGVDAILNDNLVGTCTGLCSLAIGFCSFFVVFLMSLLVYRQLPQVALLIGIIVAIVCLLIPMVCFEIVNAGTTATFVCLAEDPAALQRSKPELYREIISRYDQIAL